MSTPSDMHRDAARMIWSGSYSGLEIVDELVKKYDILGTEGEREVENFVRDLRKKIAEAQPCALQAAIELFRDGHSWKEVVEILQAPCLLSSPHVIHFASVAQETVAAEQEAQQ